MHPGVFEIGLPLVTAHLLGDFVFQPARMAGEKRRISVLLAHALIHGALAYVLLGGWGRWQLPIAVFIAHGAIDLVKPRLAKTGPSIFLLDQAAHVMVLAALAWWGRAVVPDFWRGHLGRRFDQGLIVASGATLCIPAAAIIIGYWVQPYLDEIREARGKEGSQAAAGLRGLSNGGRTIGQWERALIFLFTGMGQPGAIGFLIAAKSIFRFGELKDYQNRIEAEYITIGTLMSFGLAAAISFGTFWLARWW